MKLVPGYWGIPCNCLSKLCSHKGKSMRSFTTEFVEFLSLEIVLRCSEQQIDRWWVKKTFFNEQPFLFTDVYSWVFKIPFLFSCYPSYWFSFCFWGKLLDVHWRFALTYLKVLLKLTKDFNLLVFWSFWLFYLFLENLFIFVQTSEQRKRFLSALLHREHFLSHFFLIFKKGFSSLLSFCILKWTNSFQWFIKLKKNFQVVWFRLIFKINLMSQVWKLFFQKSKAIPFDLHPPELSELLNHFLFFFVHSNDETLFFIQDILQFLSDKFESRHRFTIFMNLLAIQAAVNTAH